MPQQKNTPDLIATEIQVWPVRNPEGSRIKAMVSITFNNVLRVSGCKIIEGARGLFVSYPSEKKPGSDAWFPLAQIISREEADKIQQQVLEKLELVNSGR